MAPRVRLLVLPHAEPHGTQHLEQAVFEVPSVPVLLPVKQGVDVHKLNQKFAIVAVEFLDDEACFARGGGLAL